MDKEKMKAWHLRAFRKSNKAWTFDGKAFETEWGTQHGGMSFNVRLTRTESHLRVIASVTWVGGKMLTWHDRGVLSNEGEFYGDDHFEQAFEWLAEVMTERAEEFAEIVSEGTVKDYKLLRKIALQGAVTGGN